MNAQQRSRILDHVFLCEQSQDSHLSPGPAANVVNAAYRLMEEGHEPSSAFELAFREEDHPRKADGKFAPKGQGETGAADGALPEDHEKYFHGDIASGATAAKIPIDQLKGTRLDPKGVQNATQFMRDSETDPNKRREPISVVKNESGGYDVIDGNSTFENLKQSGWKEAPAQVFETAADAKAHEASVKIKKKIAAAFGNLEAVPARDAMTSGAKSKDEAYAGAVKALPALNSLLATMADRYGVEHFDGQDPERWEGAKKATGARSITAPIKLFEKAANKVANDYGGDWGKIGDLARGTFAVGSIDDIPKVIGDIMESGEFELARKPADRFSNPTAEGYRDLLLNLKHKETGHNVELQINHPAILEAKGPGHDLYDQVVKIHQAAQSEGRELTDGDKKTLRDLQEKSKVLYQEAWKKAIAGD